MPYLRKKIGEVLINGCDVAKMGENENAKISMKEIGFVFQGFYLNPYLNALENVIVPMRINSDIKLQNKFAS